jgi:hypothetical protein
MLESRPACTVRSSTIFFAQIAFTTLAYAAVYWFLIRDQLKRLPARTAISILFIPQLFRHLGFSALSPELVEPPEFATFTGIVFTVGDAVLLALSYAALLALYRRWRTARTICWLFVLAGIGHDVAVTFSLGSAPPRVLEQFGGHYYAATFFIPSLVLTHILILAHLRERGHELP